MRQKGIERLGSDPVAERYERTNRRSLVKSGNSHPVFDRLSSDYEDNYSALRVHMEKEGAIERSELYQPR